MHRFTMTFAEFCQKELDLGRRVSYGYQSLSACILDCVYSLRARYDSVTIPVVDRYAAVYMNGDRLAPGDTVSMLLEHIEEQGGEKAFADNVLKNHNKSGGRNGVPKEHTCRQLAQYLKYLRIETIKDFRDFEYPELLEAVIHSVKGMGDAGTNYLFMLSGDPGRCKPDVHIHHCVRDVCGEDITNEECQVLFTETVEVLRKAYPGLTVRDLDSMIWHRYHDKV